MKYCFNIIAVLLFVVFEMVIQSCSNSRRVSRKNVQLDTITVSAKNNPVDIYRASTIKEWELLNTSVALSFNWKEKTAEGRVVLKLRPYFYDADSIKLDAKSMRIDSVLLVDGTNNRPLQYRYDDNKLTVRFDRHYERKDSVYVFIKYVAMPYAEKSGGSAAINDDKGLYFINTDYKIAGKPAQIWTQGETEANSHWVPTIDKPNQRTTTRIKLTVPDSFTTLSNGYLEQKVRKEKGMRTDVWVMDKPIQVYAMMFAIGKFSIVEDKPANGREVSYYVEPEFEQYAKTMFRHTPEMVEYFSKVTGVTYPWNKYSQVVVRDYVSGAMENTSASLFGEFMNRNHRELKDGDNEDVVSHELFHQWFGDYVTAESWSNLTLNESFATYGEQLWRKYKYGPAAADKLGIKDLWSYVYGKGQRDDPALVRFHYADKEDMFDGVSYQKGASILRYLHALTGDDAFSKSMQLYLSKNALQSAEATHWRLAVEEVTGKDWNWFFNQWYYRGGHPVLDIKYVYDDAAQKLTVTVVQTQKDPVYRLPVNMRLIYGRDYTINDITLTERKETYSYPYKERKRPIIVIDDAHVIVGEVNYNFSSSEWLNVYTASSNNVINKQLAVGAARKNIDDSSARRVLDLALNDTDEDIRQLALTNLQQVKATKWQDKFKQQVMYLAEHDADNGVRASAFDVLGAWKIIAAKDLMFNATYDSSYAIAGSALGALNKVAPDTVYALAKQLVNANPKGELEDVIWDIIAAKGRQEDFGLFEERAMYYYGRKKIALVESLSDYTCNVKDVKVFDKAADLLALLTKNEMIKSYRMSMGNAIVDAANHYGNVRDNVRTNTERETADARLKALKVIIEKLMNEENDEGNKGEYKRYLKQL